MDVPPEWIPEHFAACPCGSGKPYKDCGQDALPPHPAPAIVRVGNAGESGHEPKCFLNIDDQCGGGISREHIVSEGLLGELSECKAIRIRGAQWTGNELREVSINSLASKILCQRHNTALSGLDDSATRFFRVLRDLHTTPPRRVPLKPARYWFNGFDLERWLVKVAIGAARAKYSSKDALLMPKHLTRYLLGLEPLEPPLGMYVSTVDEWDRISVERSITEFTSYYVRASRFLSGLGVRLFGWTFVIWLDRQDPEARTPLGGRRPRGVRIVGAQGTPAQVRFDWT